MPRGDSFLTPEVLLAIAVLVGACEASRYEKPSPETSPLFGSEYVDELLSCEEDDDPQVLDAFRMPLSTFLALRDWCVEHGHLQATRYMSVDEQLAIFLCVVGENTTNRAAQERFKRSGNTISRCFNIVLDAMVALCTAIVKQPAIRQSPTTPRVRDDPEMFPYFKDCLGAASAATAVEAAVADGTPHAHADPPVVPASDGKP